MSKILPLSEAKSHFPQIVRGVELREDEVIITRNGRPAAVILNYEELKRLRKTLEVLTDKNLMSQIQKSKRFYKKKKRGLSFEDVFDEPL